MGAASLEGVEAPDEPAASSPPESTPELASEAEPVVLGRGDEGALLAGVAITNVRYRAGMSVRCRGTADRLL